MFLMQAPDQEPRFRALGIGPGRLRVAGNVKFDNAHVEDPGPLRRRIREARLVPDDAPLLVAGSTHPGEERVVVEAFRRVRAQFPSAALILAPRHVERIPEVLALLDGVGLKTLRLSERNPNAAAPCTLVDTVGELASLYAAGDVAFVGGSLRPIGGHNLLEPARFGIPMVTGPHLKSVRSLASTFEKSGALAIIRDSDGLAQALHARFSDPVGARARGRTAQAEIAANQGAAGRCAEAVAAGLPSFTTTQSKP
jgi:3-deoxy-D-manno-octulosonic-acid transferase